MQTISCSKCGTPNRVGARFCARCAAPLPSAPAPVVAPPAPVTPQRPAPQYPSLHSGQAPAPQPAAAPAIQPALSSDIALLTRGCGAVLRPIARVVTLGGRAAYADLIAAEPTASGQVASAPNPQQYTPAPIETGCFLWGLAWLLVGLLVWALPKEWLAVLIFAALYLILLFLSWIGLRRPYFTRMTLNTLWNFLTTRGRGAQPQMVFALNTFDNRQVFVTMMGPLKGLTQDTVPQQGHLVQVWGIPEGQTIRAWKLEFLQVNRQPASVWLSAPRLLPLTASLLLPLTFWFIVLIVRFVGQ